MSEFRRPVTGRSFDLIVFGIAWSMIGLGLLYGIDPSGEGWLSTIRGCIWMTTGLLGILASWIVRDRWFFALLTIPPVADGIQVFVLNVLTDNVSLETMYWTMISGFLAHAAGRAGSRFEKGTEQLLTANEGGSGLG